MILYIFNAVQPFPMQSILSITITKYWCGCQPLARQRQTKRPRTKKKWELIVGKIEQPRNAANYQISKWTPIGLAANGRVEVGVKQRSTPFGRSEDVRSVCLCICSDSLLVNISKAACETIPVPVPSTGQQQKPASQPAVQLNVFVAVRPGDKHAHTTAHTDRHTHTRTHARRQARNCTQRQNRIHASAGRLETAVASNNNRRQKVEAADDGRRVARCTAGYLCGL